MKRNWKRGEERRGDAMSNFPGYRSSPGGIFHEIAIGGVYETLKPYYIIISSSI